MSATVRELFGLVRCECQGCNGRSLTNCHPGCGEGERDKARIRSLIAEGKSKDDVIKAFVSERGDEALTVPLNEGFNKLAWIFPLLTLVLTVPVIGWWVMRKRPASLAKVKDAFPDSESPSGATLSDVELTRLEALERELEALD